MIVLLIILVVVLAIALITHESNLQKAAKAYGKARREVIERACQREQQYKYGIARSLARIEANLEALNKKHKLRQ